MCYVGANPWRPTSSTRDERLVADFARGGCLVPDAHVLLSSFRDELRTLEGRRAELRGQLQALEQEHERLATTISVLEDRVGAAPESGPGDAPEEVPLVNRIVDALGTSGLRRPEMLRIFKRQGFSESAIDSAVTRLQKHGKVRRQGRRVVRVEPHPRLPEPDVPDSGGVDATESGAGPMSDPETLDRAPDQLPVPVSASGAVSVGSVSVERAPDDDGRPLTQRVRDAVQAGVDTRDGLLEFFLSRGEKKRSINRTIWDLKNGEVLEEVAGGRLAVVAVGASDRSPSTTGSDPGPVNELT